jgi:hypothetical protein
MTPTRLLEWWSLFRLSGMCDAYRADSDRHAVARGASIVGCPKLSDHEVSIGERSRILTRGRDVH